MRVLLRIMFGLMIVVGALLAIVYPWSADTIGNYEAGRHTLFEDGEWRSAIQILEAAQAPISVLVSMTVEREFAPDDARPVLTITASTGDRTALSSALPFAERPPTKPSPQANEATYRTEAGRIKDVTGGVYVFEAAPAEAEGIAFEEVEIILRAGAFELDPRARPAGFAMIGLGLVGFLLSLRRIMPRWTGGSDDRRSRRGWGRE
ncbi:MAG: hypothetical protein K5872_09555 [Rhizobiaceae bacterium]|nr:hypothetical protein [Rhizobiaceae bacterium]MCV0406460.1 hypothetical protein [Rhizobiaceae bacterium]